LREAAEIPLNKFMLLECIAVYPGFGAQEGPHELAGGHFQRIEHDRRPAAQHRLGRAVQGERGLADAGPRSNNHKLAGPPAPCNGVQAGDAAPHPEVGVRVGVAGFEAVQRIPYGIGNVERLGTRAGQCLDSFGQCGRVKLAGGSELTNLCGQRHGGALLGQCLNFIPVNRPVLRAGQGVEGLLHPLKLVRGGAGQFHLQDDLNVALWHAFGVKCLSTHQHPARRFAVERLGQNRG